MSDYGPSLRLCAMYKRESQGGKVYFTGKLGYNKVALVKTSKETDDGVEIWSLLVSETPKKEEGVGDVSGTYRDKPLDDKIPF